MLYLKIITGSFLNQSHDRRELSVAQELGCEVCVLATEIAGESCDGFTEYQISTRQFGKATWLKPFNRILAFIEFIWKSVQMEAAIVSGHDYIATGIAFLANYLRRNKAKLIYDSHEFELYQDPNRSKVKLWCVKAIEGFLLRRVDLSLMVGDRIADSVQSIYGLNKRPVVVRNIPSRWQVNASKARKIREELLHHFGLSPQGWLLMMHGAIMPGRGIEYAIRALSLLPSDICLVVMGHVNNPHWKTELDEIVKKQGVMQRVMFRSPVLLEELKDYIAACDLELVLMDGSYCLNFAYSLPNKFFETIQSCVPMICSDLPEMGGIVRKYDIGILVDENDERQIAKAVLRLRDDKERYNQIRTNMEKAKEELCWEKEKIVLKDAIQRMVKTK